MKKTLPKKQKPKIKHTSIRFSEEDRRILVALRRKHGLTGAAAVVRMALRALAERDGISL